MEDNLAAVHDGTANFQTAIEKLDHIAAVIAFNVADTLLGVANTLEATPHDELGNDIAQRVWTIRGIGLKLDNYSLQIYECIDLLKGCYHG